MVADGRFLMSARKPRARKLFGALTIGLSILMLVTACDSTTAPSDDNSSAILVVMDNEDLDGVEAALGKADKPVSKAISKGDYDGIVDAVSKGGDEVADAIDS